MRNSAISEGLLWEESVSQDLQKPGRVIHHLGLPGPGGLLGTRTSIAKTRTVDHPSLLLGSARTPRILLHSSAFHSCQAVLLTDTEASSHANVFSDGEHFILTPPSAITAVTPAPISLEWLLYSLSWAA